MKMLFSIDGKEREFNDRFRYSMYTVSNPPDTDFERKLQLAALREEMEIESSDLNCQRLEAGNTAMSYDDVEEIIREHEAKGIQISREKAARILSENNAEAAEAMEEYQSKKHLDRSVKMKVCLTLYSTSFDISGFLTEYDEFCGYMLDGNKQSAQGMFEKLGMESKTAKKAVKELMPIYKNPNVREVLEELRAGQKENEEEMPSLCSAKLYEIVKEYAAENPGKTFLNL
jgi:hypothetical protein